MTIKSKTKDNRKIEIDLTGPDGNAFVLLGHAKNLLHQLRFGNNEIESILNEMQTGDYEHLVKIFDKYLGDVVDLYR